MGDSGSSGTPFVVAIIVLLSGITFLTVILITVLVLASQLQIAGVSTG